MERTRDGKRMKGRECRGMEFRGGGVSINVFRGDGIDAPAAVLF